MTARDMFSVFLRDLPAGKIEYRVTDDGRHILGITVDVAFYVRPADDDLPAVTEALRKLAATATEMAGALSGDAQEPAPVLTADQLATVLALADAETHRMREAAEFCGECEIHPSGACEGHLDHVAAAQAYRDLTAELGGGAR